MPAGYDFATFKNATIAPAGIDVYSASAIPGWNRSVLVTGMRVGTIYRVPLDKSGTKVSGPPLEYFRAASRYRDLALSPDGGRVFVVSDSFGTTQDPKGETTKALTDPGALVEFTYAAPSRPH